MSDDDKPPVWLADTVTTPPMSTPARRETGFLLRLLQQGEMLSMPESRPMPSVGSRCHELRVDDDPNGVTWRLFYRIDSDAIVIVHWCKKKTQRTPKKVIDLCKERLSRYDQNF